MMTNLFDNEPVDTDSTSSIREDYAKLLRQFSELSDDNYEQYLRFNIQQTQLLKAKIAEVDDELNEVTSKINNQLQRHTDTTIDNIRKCQSSLADVQEKLDSLQIIGQLADFQEELGETAAKWALTTISNDREKLCSDVGYELFDSTNQSFPVRRALICQKAKEIIQNLIDGGAKIRLDLTSLSGEKLTIDRHSLNSLKSEFSLHEDRLKYQMDQIWAETFKSESSIRENVEFFDTQQRIFEQNRITLRLNKSGKVIFAEMGASMLVLGIGNEKFRHLEAKTKQLVGFFLKNIVQFSPKTRIDLKIEDIDAKNIRIWSIFSLADKKSYDGEILLSELEKLFEKLGSTFDIDFSTKIVETFSDEFISLSTKFGQNSTKNNHSFTTTSLENNDCSLLSALPPYKLNFKSLFGHYLFNDLLKLVVQNILKPELLASAGFKTEIQKNGQFSEKFTNLLTAARHFKGVMIKNLNIENDQPDELDKFSTEIEKLYMEAKCQNVLSSARQLIMDPNLHDSVDVVVGNDDPKENVKVESKKEKPSTSDWDWDTEDDWDTNTEQKITGDKFQQCKISIAIEKLCRLIRDTLDGADSAKTATETDQLFNLARHCFDLFIAIYIDSHREHMNHMPLHYALAHNNCQYMAHTAAVFASKSSVNDFSPLSDYIPVLKKMAANFWAQFMNERKPHFLECLKMTHFSNLSDNKILAHCRKTLKQCLLQIQSLNKSWNDVWPTIVSLKASSHFARLILNALIDKITVMEDITASDTYLIKEIFEEFLYELEAIFTIDKFCQIGRFCQPEYSKFKELIFVLSSNLQQIEDRWFNGPLAKLMSADEVKRLIRALFQNTDKRAHMLQKIR
uniref:Centromere/kinetochore protein zw10-like protein n=1 Tax=Romanomermis culicivorax TaxID=13658 RepID=A0A915I674_ROMCU